MKHAKRTKVRTLWLLAAIITTIGFAALSLTGCRSHDDSGPIGITSAVITVTAPVTGAAPSATANGVGSFAIGPVTWSPAVSGTFAAETAYTAGVTLTANSGYTFKGLANASINGNTAVITGNTGSAVTLTFTFPATSEPAVVTIAAIPGLTQPIAKEFPSTGIETAQYIGTVTWNPDHVMFAAGTVYTAAITLTAKGGYTLQGVAANFFTVAGATATNAANSGVVTAVFPPAIVQTFAVSFATPTGSGAASADPETAEEDATVTISADPDNGFRFIRWEIVSGGTFAFTPNATTNPATFTMPESDVSIRAVFEELPPNTPNLNVSHPHFDAVSFGYAQPAAVDVEIHNSGTGEAAVTSIELIGDDPEAFILGGNTGAQAIAIGARPVITVQPNAGLAVGTYTAVINVNYDGEYSPAFNLVSFTVHAALIDSPAVTGITAPATGAVPDTSAVAGNNFTVGAVTWSGSPVRFAAGVAYTASVTLTANTGYTFTGLITATIDGFTAAIGSNSGSTVTLSRTFDATAATGAKFAVYWVNQQGDSGITNITDGADIISRSGDETITIGAISEGYTLQQWSLNGVNTGETGASFTFSSVGRANGSYVIGLVVSKGGEYFNVNFTVTVTN